MSEQIQQQVAQLLQQVAQLQQRVDNLERENQQLRDQNAHLQQVALESLNTAVHILVENGRYEDAHRMHALCLQTHCAFERVCCVTEPEIALLCESQLAQSSPGRPRPDKPIHGHGPAPDLAARAGHGSTRCNTDHHEAPRVAVGATWPGPPEHKPSPCGTVKQVEPLQQAFISFNMQLHLAKQQGSLVH